MATYIDGFVVPIKKKNVAAYKKMATIGRNVWMKFGALDYHECIATKVDQPYGLPFKKLCKLKPDETVIFAYIVYKSKAQREKVNKKVHEYFSKMEHQEMPFDMKRMTAGEFETLVRSK